MKHACGKQEQIFEEASYLEQGKHDGGLDSRFQVLQRIVQGRLCKCQSLPVFDS